MRFYEIAYTDDFWAHYRESPDYYIACDEIEAILTGDCDNVDLDTVIEHLRTLLILALLTKGDD